MSNPSDDDLIAGEYVLGVLDLSELRAAQARLKTDADFAARVQSWQQRLSDLNDGYDEAPAPNLLPAIEARLFPSPQRRSPRGWLGGLIGFGLTTAAAVLVLAVLAFGPAKPSLIADLTAEAPALHYTASLTGNALTLTRRDGAAAATDKDYELWLIEGDKAPISLGIMHETLSIALDNLQPGFVLAITLEPKGGSPGGKPSGPILAAAALKPT